MFTSHTQRSTCPALPSLVFSEHCGRQMAAVITEDNVYSEAEVNDAPPAGGDDQVQLPGPEGNIQGQVASTKACRLGYFWYFCRNDHRTA